MTELRETLEKSLLDDSSLAITINSKISKLTLRVNDSRQMIFYGIGLDRQQGFTLSIEIDKNSKEGKKLRETLNKSDFLTDFKIFESKRSMTYLKDFGQGIEFIEQAIHDLLNKLDNHSGLFYYLTVNRTDGNHEID
jgi:hypothetical protein